ncbi:DUF3320 domain-containing protein [Ferrovibrio sp.]|uniref:DUF3320 domain-containing protein n=1 Tax=Ferrovibrio sp. TaxID=1917215 RepID=UPI003D0F6971
MLDVVANIPTGVNGAETSALKEKLERARTELLDLSTRNRLISTPRGTKAKQIEIIDELSSEIFRLLVNDGKALTFLPGRKAAGAATTGEDDEIDEISELAQPEDEAVDARGVASRHGDTKLQTRLTSEGLQKRLLDLYLDAKTLQEEQGVNILYLALGMLKWFEDEKSDKERFAPLILLPVALDRGSAGERFKLRWLQEEPAANLSLGALMKRQFGLELPQFTEGDEAFDPSTYLERVAASISGQPRWSVLENDTVLGLFSFAKFLMYRDLELDIWPAGLGIADSPIVSGLLGQGFKPGEGLIGEDEPVDPHIDPENLVHVVDADSSQTLAVHEVRRGRDMVIQGPPGTGKSQTIANVIASAVYDGKTVLFVAEKMAALEVVKRRLDANGIGDICLELHSNKANKRFLLEELRRTWDLGKPSGAEDGALIRQLRQNRDKLNEHVSRLHRQQQPCGLSPYQVIGHLVRLRQTNDGPAKATLVKPETWSRPERQERELQLRDLAGRIEDIGPPSLHPWRHARIPAITPMDVERMVVRLRDLQAGYKRFETTSGQLCDLLETTGPDCLAEVENIVTQARRVAAAPAVDPTAITDEVWIAQQTHLVSLVGSGEKVSALLAELAMTITDIARDQDFAAADAILNRYRTGWLIAREPAYAVARTAIAIFIEHLNGLKAALELQYPMTLASAYSLLQIVERVAAAPPFDTEAMLNDVWRNRVADIADLVEAGRAYSDQRRELDDIFTATAWDTDMKAARQHLATHATSFLRFLNGNFKRAKMLVNSVLATATPMQISEQLKQLDKLIANQKTLARLAADDDLGRKAFGSLWRRERSDWLALEKIVTWSQGNGLSDLSAEIRRVVATTKAHVILSLARPVERAVVELKSSVGELIVRLQQLAPAAFPVEALDDIDLAVLGKDLGNLDHAAETLARIFAKAPHSLEGQRYVLERLKELRGEAAKLEVAVEPEGPLLGQKVFGTCWKGENSDWTHLRKIVEWAKGNGSDLQALVIHKAIGRSVDQAHIGVLAEDLSGMVPTLVGNADQEFRYLSLDRKTAFGTEDVSRIKVDAVVSQIGLWIDHAEDLSKWTAYAAKARLAREAGLADLVNRLEDDRLNARSVLPEFEMSYYEALFNWMVQDDPELARFDGDGHTRMAEEFGRLDQKRIHLARREVAAVHHQRIPRQEGGAGPIGALKGEIVKRRNHMPIRQLMKRAGPAIQALKPVFMMSPLSVAQFLEPGSLTFDILVVDEASQIQPVDAIGAIARCRQIVVVGDDKQLPPTRFFDKMLAGADEDEDETTTKVADVESILGLCVSKGLPQRMLRWHYRSRHQSLIAISNREFYENKLYIVPSPYTAEAGMGLRFHYLPHATYDSGGTSTNIEEAKEVAKAIIQHARSHPDLSLGVATFSTKQRRAVLDEVERLRRLNPDTEHYFSAHPAEPFFIKNLENVQGDERDVIFISVGYGKNAQGYMSMSFGPLNRDGGERRLNVLISRAKRRCEVFSSITDDDIDLERAKGKGVFSFKLFLHFARTGNLSLGHKTDREHDSVFEEQVANALKANGYNVHAQVGLAGFFIDLAVADFDRPGRYVLGIECDGAAYHSSRSARDRDRLRQSVLEDHGWIIHRIWSTDWFNRPQQQLAKAIAAIEAAKEELSAREGAAHQNARAVPIEIVTVEREHVTEIGLQHVGAAIDENGASLAVPYIQAILTAPTHLELHDVPSGMMEELVTQIVTAEGPIHLDEMVIRLREHWGLLRAGNRIRQAIARGVDIAVKSGRLSKDGEFYSIPGAEIRVRDRGDALSLTLRKPEILPPAEIQKAVITFVAAHLGATEEEAIIGTSRLFGFKATSAQLKQVIVGVIAAAEQDGHLVRQSGLLRIPSQS